MRRTTTLVLAAVVLALGAGTAWIAGVGRAPPRGAAPGADGPEPRPRASTGGGGGLFERFAGDAPTGGPLVARLFSPRPLYEECLDLCPKELHVVAGREGFRSAAAAVDGIVDAVERLAAQPALDRELASALTSTLHAIQASARGASKRPLRALFVAGGTDVPAEAHRGVGLSVSDLHDAYFDRRRPLRGGGARILVNRLEGVATHGERGRLLAGVIEFAGDGVGGGSGAPDPREVAPLRNPIGLHFRDEALPTVGIGLDLAGALFTYGYWGEGLRRLPADAGLKEAVEGVLRAV